MRRLAIGLLSAAAGARLLAAGGGSPAGAQDEPDDRPAPVDVLQVSGLFDPIVVDAIDDAIERSVADGAQALILQVNTRGAVVGRDEMEELLERIDGGAVPIAVWVGPSGARLYGTPPSCSPWPTSPAWRPARGSATPACRCSPNGVPVDFGDGGGRRCAPARSGLSDARRLGVFEQRISDEGIPTIVNMVDALDGYEEDGVVLETTEERVARRRHRPPGHDGRSSASPSSASSTSCSTPSPARPSPTCCCSSAWRCWSSSSSPPASASPASSARRASCSPAPAWPRCRPGAGRSALILAAMLAFAVDVQVGVPRFWTGVGIVLTIIGSLWLFEPLPGVTLRPSWITLLAGIGGIVLAFVVGMPSMVRTRFATPTIGREWMIGELGEVVEAVDPDGVVSVGSARWRARTNRATPVAAGEQVRVVAIDGVTLEVEPLEGAARDHRERRARRPATATFSGP